MYALSAIKCSLKLMPKRGGIFILTLEFFNFGVRKTWIFMTFFDPSKYRLRKLRAVSTQLLCALSNAPAFSSRPALSIVLQKIIVKNKSQIFWKIIQNRSLKNAVKKRKTSKSIHRFGVFYWLNGFTKNQNKASHSER